MGNQDRTLQRVLRGVYLKGAQPPTDTELALAFVVKTGGAASHTLCELDDIRWEQAMESALRKKLMTVEQFESLPSKRIQRVMALRPPGAPPTESLLETLMVQLIRTEPSQLPTPSRQVVVSNKWDRFVARVDLAWPERGIFLELDGQHYKDQPVYDANRQTAVVAAKAWLPGRFTWYEVTRNPKPTLWRLIELFDRAVRTHLVTLTPDLVTLAGNVLMRLALPLMLVPS